jgi:peroxiredoxin
MFKIPLLATLLASATAPKVGSVAPDFTAVDSDGKTHHLAELVKKQTVVLAFFPKAFTMGCTHQMKSFRDKHDELTRKGVLVLAVAMDDAETMGKFKKELGAQFPFIADPEAKVAKLFGMHKDNAKVSGRANIVIGEGRKVLAVESGAAAIMPDEAVAACPVRPASP